MNTYDRGTKANLSTPHGAWPTRHLEVVRVLGVSPEVQTEALVNPAGHADVLQRFGLQCCGN